MMHELTLFTDMSMEVMGVGTCRDKYHEKQN